MIAIPPGTALDTLPLNCGAIGGGTEKSGGGIPGCSGGGCGLPATAVACGGIDKLDKEQFVVAEPDDTTDVTFTDDIEE